MRSIDEEAVPEEKQRGGALDAGAAARQAEPSSVAGISVKCRRILHEDPDAPSQKRRLTVMVGSLLA